MCFVFWRGLQGFFLQVKVVSWEVVIKLNNFEFRRIDDMILWLEGLKGGS